MNICFWSEIQLNHVQTIAQPLPVSNFGTNLQHPEHAIAVRIGIVNSVFRENNHEVLDSGNWFI